MVRNTSCDSSNNNTTTKLVFQRYTMCLNLIMILTKTTVIFVYLLLIPCTTRSHESDQSQDLVWKKKLPLRKNETKTILIFNNNKNNTMNNVSDDTFHNYGWKTLGPNHHSIADSQTVISQQIIEYLQWKNASTNLRDNVSSVLSEQLSPSSPPPPHVNINNDSWTFIRAQEKDSMKKRVKQQNVNQKTTTLNTAKIDSIRKLQLRISKSNKTRLNETSADEYWIRSVPQRNNNSSHYNLAAQFHEELKNKIYKLFADLQNSNREGKFADVDGDVDNNNNNDSERKDVHYIDALFSQEIPSMKQNTLNSVQKAHERFKRWESSSNDRQNDPQQMDSWSQNDEQFNPGSKIGMFKHMNDAPHFPIHLPQTNMILASTEDEQQQPGMMTAMNPEEGTNADDEYTRFKNLYRENEIGKKSGWLVSNAEGAPMPFNSMKDQKYFQAQENDNREPAMQRQAANGIAMESKDTDANLEPDEFKLPSHEDDQRIDIGQKEGQFPLYPNSVRAYRPEPGFMNELPQPNDGRKNFDVRAYDDNDAGTRYRHYFGDEMDTSSLGFRDISALTRMTLDNAGTKKWPKQRRRREVANTFRDSNMPSKINAMGGLQDVGPLMYYQATDMEHPYYLYYPVVYVQGNQQKLHYLPIPASKFQNYDPDTLSHLAMENAPSAKDSGDSLKSFGTFSGSELAKAAENPELEFLHLPDRSAQHERREFHQFHQQGNVRSGGSALKDTGREEEVGGVAWGPLARDESGGGAGSSYQGPGLKNAYDRARMASMQQNDLKDMEAVPWASMGQENTGKARAQLSRLAPYDNFGAKDLSNIDDSSNVVRHSSGSIKKALHRRRRKRQAVSQIQDVFRCLWPNNTQLDSLMADFSEIRNRDARDTFQSLPAENHSEGDMNRNQSIVADEHGKHNSSELLQGGKKCNEKRSNAVPLRKCFSLLLDVFETLMSSESLDNWPATIDETESDHLQKQKEKPNE